MKKSFEIKYEYTGYNNELKGLEVEGKLYTLEDLTFETKELLTVMTYADYQLTEEYFMGIAQMIGYETTLQAILDLAELGVTIASASIYRKLVIESSKAKYKGLWR
jgi:hypothetical protein